MDVSPPWGVNRLKDKFDRVLRDVTIIDIMTTPEAVMMPYLCDNLSCDTFFLLLLLLLLEDSIGLSLISIIPTPTSFALDDNPAMQTTRTIQRVQFGKMCQVEGELDCW